MILSTSTTDQRDKQTAEEWRWRFALLPMRLENNNVAVWVWLEWYETRGGYGQMFQEYRVGGRTYRYVDSGEY